MSTSSQIFGAKVKAVLSGDSLVLVPSKSPAGKIPPERILSLAFISAPRFRRDEGDEPFAFASREFLRTRLVGKDIRFKVLYKTVNGREYGDILVANNESVIEKVVAAGFAKVRDDAVRREEREQQNNENGNESGFIHELVESQSKAKDSGLGIWSSAEKDITTIYGSSLPQEYIGTSTKFDSIVERVLSGDRIQLRLIAPKGGIHYVVSNALIAGIKSPRATATATNPHPEPFGDVAKLFVESRLLDRSVKSQVLAITPTEQLIVSVAHPAGNIAVAEVEAGLATVADWQSEYVGPEFMGQLRTAETRAKANGLNLWKGKAGGADVGKGSKNSKSFDAVVARIISGDTLVVRPRTATAGSQHEDKTIQLASLRGPRANDAKTMHFVNEAREFLRKRLIGKHVIVTILHTRPKTEQFDERDIATVAIPGSGGRESQDIGELLVENGLASVIRHRKDDDQDRSPIWDTLIEKEKEATNKGRGIHSNKPPPQERIVDASESVSKAKTFSNFLTRTQRVAGVVEYIPSAGRYRILIPRDNCRITLVLAGIRVPRTGEPGGQEAHEFANRRVLQRDVEVHIRNVDRVGGGFIGDLFVPHNSKETFAKALVEEGLASVHSYSAEQAGLETVLSDAQEKAQKEHKGIWKDYNPEKEEEKVQEQEQERQTKETNVKEIGKEYVDVLVTHVEEDGTFKVQIGKDEISQLERLVKELNIEGNNNNKSLAAAPRSGQMVVAKFNRQGPTKILRGKVRRVDIGGKKAEITAIDYGFSESVGFKDIYEPTTATTKVSIAKEAKLSFVKLPAKQTGYLEESIDEMRKLIENKQLVANIDFKNFDLLSLTLYDTNQSKSSFDSIQADLVELGFLIVDKTKRNLINYLQAKDLANKENIAKSKHLGIWEYGDIEGDENDDN